MTERTRTKFVTLRAARDEPAGLRGRARRILSVAATLRAFDFSG
jgi:hypothetical protein